MSEHELFVQHLVRDGASTPDASAAVYRRMALRFAGSRQGRAYREAAGRLTGRGDIVSLCAYRARRGNARVMRRAGGAS